MTLILAGPPSAFHMCTSMINIMLCRWGPLVASYAAGIRDKIPIKFHVLQLFPEDTGYLLT